MNTVKTRKQAANDGEDKYFTGKACINGHLSLRYTSSGICCKCNTEAAKKYNREMRKRVNARLQGHFIYDLHPDDIAKAFAYCQALDLQRGLVPASKIDEDIPAPTHVEIPAEIARRRAELLRQHTHANSAPYLPKP